MLNLWLQLLLMLVLILFASQLFTNALEYFGHRAGISAGVIGSVFAAVATALPETTVPLVAIFAGTNDPLVNQQISVGAILGAPLMLSTLSLTILALFALKQRGMKGRIMPERKGYIRDLNFFMVAFLLAATAMFVPHDPLCFRVSISIILVGLYLCYLVFTFKASRQLVIDGHGVTPDEPLLISKLGLKDSGLAICLQLICGFVLLLLGAKGFITNVEHISKALQVSALLLSLLIIPFATEFPEKINSILWVRKNKDTLGVGNITGAMVFQSTLLPALGIILTPWQPSKDVLLGISVTLLASIWLRLHAAKDGMRVINLLVNGGLYATYLCAVLS